MEEINGDKLTNIINQTDKEISYIKCTYDVKEDKEIQILNYRSENYVNDEIASKIKILSDNKIENLCFTKKFDKLGINTVTFIIEKELNNMSYLFYKCSSIKEINFISIKTTQVNKMRAMFVECFELEYLDLSNFDTSNVTDMAFMFNNCRKLKEIKVSLLLIQKK